MKSTPEKLAYAKSYREKNREKINKKLRQYYIKNKQRYIDSAKKWAEQNREKSNKIKMAHKRRVYLSNPKEFNMKQNKLRNNRIRKDAKFREEQNRRSREYYIKNRDKILKNAVNIRKSFKERARRILRNEVFYGRIIRPTHCSKCNVFEKIEAHHPDYSKPLEVIWLCSLCHGEQHRKHQSP